MAIRPDCLETQPLNSQGFVVFPYNLYNVMHAIGVPDKTIESLHLLTQKPSDFILRLLMSKVVESANIIQPNPDRSSSSTPVFSDIGLDPKTYDPFDDMVVVEELAQKAADLRATVERL